MKKLCSIIIILFNALVINAQSSDFRIEEKQIEEEQQNHYKEVVSQIFEDDELFVLFYLNFALVVDPTKESQVVEPITTDNPWESLSKYLKGKSNIYFCPAGYQLNIAIEYMPNPLDNSILMSDQFGMYRLSSPEELFRNRGDIFKKAKHKAVVFGGLKYDGEINPANDNLLAFRGNREAIEGYEYLKSTFEEAVYIDSIIRKNGIETALLTGEEGTEKSFAQISNHQVDILHIASHGFYEPNKDNTESSSLQEWMMSHAGLILSGVNEESGERSNDGRLTAYEISQTDLSGVNLVVLSACKTGLGDVKENDVYGLLKGFKKAGAGTLLLTLGNVNDTVTSLLMKRFYNNLFRGDNPRRALENAQRFIRLQGSGKFNKPEFWATFILVDDLDRNIGATVTDELKNDFLLNIVGNDKIYSGNNLFPNWEKIRQNLKDDEAIVRICPYSIGKDSIDYVAMVGNPRIGHCNVVRLFTIKNGKIGNYPLSSLDRIPISYMDSAIWQPILPLIRSKHNIYCHFSGILQWYPFESLPNVNDYNIYRMSSLNRLFEDREKIYVRDNSFVALFGGLNYDKSEPDNKGFPKTSLDRGSIDGLQYLYGTKIETDDIAKILNESHFRNVKLFQGDVGTESALNEIIEDSSLRILHLATHAFGFDYSQPINDFLSIGKEKTIIDCLLDCSGIALAGANNNISGEIILAENDNILSGSEIIRKDLSKVSLVVLSTCQMGVNGISLTTNDSPWDLIKAFKMAGANTILHSLWNVDDESTVMLMRNFYYNIVKGYDLINALKLAKQSVRSHKEKGWDDPRYWTSFVLIDAFD